MSWMDQRMFEIMEKSGWYKDLEKDNMDVEILDYIQSCSERFHNFNNNTQNTVVVI